MHCQGATLGCGRGLTKAGWIWHLASAVTGVAESHLSRPGRQSVHLF
jgi:hypothetical protein